jgi:hypothetical protein
LKVLVEGAATLYQFESGNSRRFFFKIADRETDVQPLIFKRYRASNGATGTNNQFREQLDRQLECLTVPKTRLRRMEYKPDPLTHFFQEFNNCMGGDQQTYEKKTAKFNFQVALRFGFNYAEASIAQTSSSIPESRKVAVDFDGKFYPRYGMELEVLMPYGGNKWSLFLEPTYQHYQTEKQFVQRIALFEVPTNSEITYKTMELPIGIRHYLFLSQQSQLFLNVSLALIFNFDSEITFETPTRLGEIPDLEIEGTEEYLSLGMGYKLKQKWSLEVRYNTKRDLLADKTHWTSAFDNNFSFVLGYNFL